MHIYIYADYLGEKKYYRTIANIETRLTDLGQHGKIIRMEALKSVSDTVLAEIKHGAKTITAVGDDNLVNQVASAIANSYYYDYLSNNIPLGIIPIGKNNNLLANFFGIPKEELACEVLAARRIEKIDLGLARLIRLHKGVTDFNQKSQKVNYYFLSQVNINTQDTILEIDYDYTLEISEVGEINVINFPTFFNLPKNVDSSPQDGKLELFVKTGKIMQTFLSPKKLIIFNKHLPLILDNSVEMPASAEITVVKQGLNIIVGRERNF